MRCKITPVLMAALLLITGKSFSQVTVPAAPVPKDTIINGDLQDAITDNIPVISLDENDMQDGSAQNVSSVLGAGRDPFLSAAAFKFGAVRFRIRGYDADLFSTYINGVPMENLDNGFTPYGLWGGLNDVMRNRDQVHGLKANPYAMGDLGGLTYFDTRASRQRKQTNLNYAISNRNYFNRMMITHSTGLNSRGWAFSFSGSRRWANEGYAPGTYYNGYSAFAAVDKRLNDRHLLSLTAMIAPTENGRQGATVQEMIDIAGDINYNPYWGYQNGKKRNASVAKTIQPVTILTHDWKINDKTSLLTSGSFITGKRSVSGLDWYNVADPRPDYYRYLPSYQLDPVFAAEQLAAMKADVNLRQINWDKLYQTNYGSIMTIDNVNGIPGNTVTGKRSRYILENKVVATNRYNVNTVLNTNINQHIDFTAGGSFQYQQNHYYKEVEDLLGGDFYMDLNQFAERDFATNTDANQNDLNRPNRVVKEGDKLGYNYNIDIKRAAVWAQSVIKFNKVDFFVAAEHSYTSFFRTGNVKVGLFPQNSYGKSAVNHFYNYTFKGGVTYKLDGRNYFFTNAAYMTRAPFFENAYLAPRTRDAVQDNLTSEKISSAEAGYVMNAPKIKIRLTGFYTQIKDQMNVLTFYHDEYRNFVNYAISGIDKVHFGGEFGFDAKLYKGLSINAAANVGRYYFTGRQQATVTVDNSSTVVSQDLIYSKNYRVPTPQEAYSIGLDYRSPKFWFLNVNFNYFNKMWLDYNPLRRTEAAVNGVPENDPLRAKILNQEELDAQYTLDAFAGYSWLMNNKFKSLKKRHYLLFNLGVNNILNNRHIVTGGFEQLRFDFAAKNVDKFPPKKFYAYGINFFASIGLRF